MIIDACCFAGEMDMLRFRMDILSPIVDLFLVIETDRTHQGTPRPWTLKDTRLPKLIARRATAASGDPFVIEQAPRHVLKDACAEFPDDTLLMLSDVDEIPRREAVELFKQRQFGLPMRCDLNVFYYRAHWKRPDIVSISLSTVGHLRQIGGQRLRDDRINFEPVMPFPFGWHLSYFGGTEAIQNKLRSFAHKEFNRPEFLDREWLEKCQRLGISLLKCGTPIERVDKSFFPDYFIRFAPKEWWL